MADTAELDNFDWVGHKRTTTDTWPLPRTHLMFQAPTTESDYDRKLRMLTQVANACMACSMCELGRRGVQRDTPVLRDPHVFSNMNPVRVIAVGQNPGWTEVLSRQPFTGEAGQNFDRELAAGGLSRADFYVTNCVKCHTDRNARPSAKHMARCAPFLDIEIGLIRPRLIVALGSVAFGALCPEAEFSASLGVLVESAKYELPVYATYHPSPRNLDEPSLLAAFRKHMRILCAVVAKLKSE